MAYLDRAGHPVPLRAGRRLHRLRRLPLLAASARPTPTATTCGPAGHGQRRQGRRPGPRQRRGRLQLDDLPRAAGAGRGSAGRSTRTSARPGRRRLLGLDARRLHRQLRRQLAAVLRPVPQRAAPGEPAVRQGPHRHRCQERRGLLRHPAGRRHARHGCRRCPGSSRPRRSPSTRNWPANYGAWYISQVLDALTTNPEVWSKTALFLTYDENDGFFDHVVPPYPPPSPAHGRIDRRRLTASSTPATPTACPVRTGSGSACR